MNLRGDLRLMTNLNKLLKTSNDLTPLMKRVGVYMLASTNETFQSEGRPEKWKDISKQTKNRRASRGKWPGRILQVTGRLKGSIVYQAGKEDVVIGTSVPYARKHQFGFKVPARPFLGFLDEDVITINRIVEDYWGETVKSL